MSKMTTIVGFFEDNDVKATCHDGYVECEWFSPAGENFVFSLEYNEDNPFVSMRKSLIDYAFYFDPEEHALEMTQVPENPGIRILVEDADKIAEFLDDLVMAARVA